jgi:hypothetical protein
MREVVVRDYASPNTSADSSTWTILYIVFILVFMCALLSLCTYAATPTYYYVGEGGGARRPHRRVRTEPLAEEYNIILDE